MQGICSFWLLKGRQNEDGYCSTGLGVLFFGENVRTLEVTSQVFAYFAREHCMSKLLLFRMLKFRLLSSNVISVLQYGTETWLVLRTIVAKLQVIVNRCLFRILKLRWQDI